jgi:hypothetical protein
MTDQSTTDKIADFLKRFEVSNVSDSSKQVAETYLQMAQNWVRIAPDSENTLHRLRGLWASRESAIQGAK